MGLPWYFYWAVKSLDYTVTDIGVKIVVYTNHACHLWLRWTNLDPWSHVVETLDRGIAIDKDARYCFAIMGENEQEEMGDTKTHTFTKEPWPYCETRWFYLFGTVEDEDSPSESAIFKYHRLAPEWLTKYFWPHNWPLTDSCDGRVRRGYIGDLTWADVHDGAGTWARSIGETAYADIMSTRTANRWNWIHRNPILFNTDEVPLGSTILEAKLWLYFFGYLNTLSFQAAVNVFESWPVTTGQIIPLDYQNIGSVPLSDPKLIDNIDLFEWSYFTLNAQGRALVIPEGCTKLAIRESAFDAPRNSPPWGSLKRAFIQWESADAGDPELKPCLEVTYSPP